MAQPLHIILRLVEWSILAILLVLFLLIISPLLPTKNYLVSYAVVTGSMAPNVPIGTLALVSPIEPFQLQVGDVIAFPHPDDPSSIILHRITTINQSNGSLEIKTKGDNNSATDNWTILGTQVRGKMVSTIPYLGYPIKFAQTPKGFVIMVGIPAGVLLALQLRTLREGINEEIQRRANELVNQKKVVGNQT